MDKILEFTSNHVLLVSALMISFFVLVFSELRRKASGLVNVEAGDLKARLVQERGRKRPDFAETQYGQAFDLFTHAMPQLPIRRTSLPSPPINLVFDRNTPRT